MVNFSACGQRTAKSAFRDFDMQIARPAADCLKQVSAGRDKNFRFATGRDWRPVPAKNAVVVLAKPAGDVRARAALYAAAAHYSAHLGSVMGSMNCE
jgi:hypothetical protein